MGQRHSSTRRRTRAASNVPTPGNKADKVVAIYEILRRLTPGNPFPTWQTFEAIDANVELYANGAALAMDGKVWMNSRLCLFLAEL